MPQFDPSTFPSQLLWLFICFGGLIWIMANHGIPQLEKVFRLRISYYEKNAKQLKDLEEQIKQLEEKAELELNTTRFETQSLLETEVKDINAKINQKIQEQLIVQKQRRDYALSLLRAQAEIDIKSISLEIQKQILQGISKGFRQKQMREELHTVHLRHGEQDLLDIEKEMFDTNKPWGVEH